MQNNLVVVVMELILISFLCVSFFALQTPCFSLPTQHLQYSFQEKENTVADQLSRPMNMPRKLGFTERLIIQGHEGQGTIMTKKTQHNNAGETPAGDKAYQKEQVVPASTSSSRHGSLGTRQEWSERADTSEYFTMDYTHVRRRRPIHNKSLPVAP